MMSRLSSLGVSARTHAAVTPSCRLNTSVKRRACSLVTAKTSVGRPFASSIVGPTILWIMASCFLIDSSSSSETAPPSNSARSRSLRSPAVVRTDEKSSPSTTTYFWSMSHSHPSSMPSRMFISLAADSKIAPIAFLSLRCGVAVTPSTFNPPCEKYSITRR